MFIFSFPASVVYLLGFFEPVLGFLLSTVLFQCFFFCKRNVFSTSIFLNIVLCFVFVFSWPINWILALCLNICKFSRTFELCGVCFNSIVLLMSDNSYPVFIAYFAGLHLFMFGFLKALNVLNSVIYSLFLFPSA